MYCGGFESSPNARRNSLIACVSTSGVGKRPVQTRSSSSSRVTVWPTSRTSSISTATALLVSRGKLRARDDAKRAGIDDMLADAQTQVRPAAEAHRRVPRTEACRFICNVSASARFRKASEKQP